MEDLIATARIASRLTWDYNPRFPRLSKLYEHSKEAQWNASTDIDWSLDVGFNSPLRDDSGFSMAAFESSPLARYGRSMWDTFRWEFQSWVVSQFLHGEQGALVAAARLVEVLPSIEAKYQAASQVADEARHVEVFSRYLREKIPAPYPPSSSMVALLKSGLEDARWEMVALAAQIVIESIASSSFRVANFTLFDGLIKQITRLVANDEARHISYGIQLLDGMYEELSAGERAEWEEFILEAAHLMLQRFMLDEVWERLGIDRDEGIAFARSSEMMVAYRQAVFTNMIFTLKRIGLMTPRVHAGLARLNLIGPASRRAVGNQFHVADQTSGPVAPAA